jgi:hypothetical protein
MQSKIIFPNIDVFAADECGNTDDVGRLPDEEVLLCGETGGLKVCVPVQAGSLQVKVGAFPTIVLLEGVGCVCIGSESTSDSDFQR